MDSSEVKDSDYECGIGFFRPRWLQRLKTPKVFLFIFTILGIIDGARSTYFVGIISTLEKRFSFDSTSTAMVIMIGNISPIITSVVAGYFANNFHRPRLMAVSMFIIAVSSILNSIPYFMYGPANPQLISTSNDTQKYQLCSANRTNFTSEEGQVEAIHSTLPVLVILTLCSFVNNVGSTIYYTIGTPYMDDSVKKKNSLMYISFSTCFRMLGPPFGFLVSSFCLKFSEDPFNDPGIDSRDPRYIGAWWLGFVIFGVILILLAFLFLLFPRSLTYSTKVEAINKEKDKERRLSYRKTFKDIPREIWKMLINPVFFWFNMQIILKGNGFVGYATFMPKYMENQYQQTASDANLISGTAMSMPLMVGSIIGGVLTTKFKPSPRTAILAWLFVEILGSLPGMMVPIFLPCPNIKFPGTRTNDNGMLNLTNTCNQDCLCGQESYEPLCGPDGVSTYFNPCYAGCDIFNKTDDKTVFMNCRCSPNDTMWDTVEMTGGYCEANCNYFHIYVIALGVCETMASLTFAIQGIVALRCVPRKDKSLSIGLTDALSSLLIMLPSPLIYGALTDAACIVWEEKNGKRGNCWLYENDKFNKYLHIPFILFFVGGCMSQVLLVYYANRMRNFFAEEEDQENIEMKSENKEDGKKAINNESSKDGKFGYEGLKD